MLHRGVVIGSEIELNEDSLICAGLGLEAVLHTGKLWQYLYTLHENLLFCGDFSEFRGTVVVA